MIELEPFSEYGLRRVRQAHDLKHLINEERDWLETVQSVTVSRYETFLGGFHNLYRGAQRRSIVEANIVLRDKAAIGVSTIIFNQRVVHPAEGTFSGDDIDFWLRQGVETKTHHEVLRRLLMRNNQRPAFATVRVDQPNPPQGLDVYMDAVGAPASLTPVPGKGEKVLEEIAWGGAVAQLYQYPKRS